MRLFRNVREAKAEQCSFGCNHHVVYNEIADVTEVVRISRRVFYGDIDCGIGYDVFYRDYFGNLYFQETTWDGPSQILRDVDDQFWHKRPAGFDANKTLNGSSLNRNGELI